MLFITDKSLPRTLNVNNVKQHSRSSFFCPLLTLGYCLLQASWTIEGSSLPQDWPQRGTLVFKEYGLQYRKGLELALKGITLNIHEREKVSHRIRSSCDTHQLCHTNIPTELEVTET